MPAAFARAAALSVRSHAEGAVGAVGMRPKWPWRAVTLVDRAEQVEVLDDAAGR